MSAGYGTSVRWQAPSTPAATRVGSPVVPGRRRASRGMLARRRTLLARVGDAGAVAGRRPTLTRHSHRSSRAGRSVPGECPRLMVELPSATCSGCAASPRGGARREVKRGHRSAIPPTAADGQQPTVAAAPCHTPPRSPPPCPTSRRETRPRAARSVTVKTAHPDPLAVVEAGCDSVPAGRQGPMSRPRQTRRKRPLRPPGGRFLVTQRRPAERYRRRAWSIQKRQMAPSRSRNCRGQPAWSRTRWRGAGRRGARPTRPWYR